MGRVEKGSFQKTKKEEARSGGKPFFKTAFPRSAQEAPGRDAFFAGRGETEKERPRI